MVYVPGAESGSCALIGPRKGLTSNNKVGQRAVMMPWVEENL